MFERVLRGMMENIAVFHQKAPRAGREAHLVECDAAITQRDENVVTPVPSALLDMQKQYSHSTFNNCGVN